MSFDPVVNGHVILYGEICYGGSRQLCGAVFGSGIQDVEGELELDLTGMGDQAHYEGVFTSTELHVTLDMKSLVGDWSSDHNMVYADDPDAGRNLLDWGVAKGVACVAPTKEEKRADLAMKGAFTRWRSLK